MGRYLLKRGVSIRTRAGVKHGGQEVELSDDEARVLRSRGVLAEGRDKEKRSIPDGVIVNVEVWSGVESCS